jgi:hypothetical protein
MWASHGLKHPTQYQESVKEAFRTLYRDPGVVPTLLTWVPVVNCLFMDDLATRGLHKAYRQCEAGGCKRIKNQVDVFGIAINYFF